MGTASEKGRALEKATRAIHEMLLRKEDLGDAKISIEPNHKFRAGGARNEIDILVRIDPDSPKERTRLFECKNRKTKVSKNDIIILADKVRRLGAEKGTMVARAFTKDAIALAAHEHIEIETVTDDRWLSDELFRFVGTTFAFHFIRLQIHRFGNDSAVPEPNWIGAVCHWKSRLRDFGEVIQDLIYEDAMSRRNSVLQLPGMIARHGSLAYEFDLNELWVGDWNVSFVQAEFDYSLSFRPSRLASTFSLEKKGRFAEFICESDPPHYEDVRIEVLGQP